MQMPMEELRRSWYIGWSCYRFSKRRSSAMKKHLSLMVVVLFWPLVSAIPSVAEDSKSATEAYQKGKAWKSTTTMPQ